MSTAACCPPTPLHAGASLSARAAFTSTNRLVPPAWPAAASRADAPASLPLPTLPAAARAIPLHRPLWQRAWSALGERWQAWHLAARQKATLRALAAMDRRTLRDVGLDEHVPRSPAIGYLDVERARW